MSVIASQISVPEITYMVPIAVSPTGYIYTQDYNSKQIRVLSLSGTQITTISTPDWYDAFCVDYINNKIYCAGVNTFCAVNLSNNTFSSFSSPWINGIAVGTDGYVYATTNSGYKIQKITPSTGAQTNIFTGTSGGNIKSDAYGIFGTCAFDNAGFLYCTTRGVGYIYKFTMSGTLLGLFATTNNIYQYIFGFTYDTTNNVFYALATGGAVYKIDKYGSSSLYATGLAGNSYGIFYDKVSAKVYATTQTSSSSMIYIINPFVPPTGITYSLSNKNLLNYYPFDTDLLNYANSSNPVNDTTSNLVAISTATTALNNGAGGSLSFPGTTNNWVKINKLNFAPTGLTISTWFKYNFATTSGGTKRIFDFGNGYGVDGLLLSFVSDFGSEMEFYVNGASYIAKISITEYTWHNYCVVINGSNASFYIDGVIQSFRLYRSGPYLTVVSVNLSTSKDLLNNFIGNSNWSPNESPNAYFNNFMIFNRAFTEDEIANTSNIYNTITVKPPLSYPVSKEQLLCYYKFDTDYLNYASGTGVSDASASGVSISANSLSLPGTSSQSFKLPTIQFQPFGITIAFWMKCATIPTNWARIFDFATAPDIYSNTNNFYMGFPTTGAMQIKFIRTYLGSPSDVFDLSYTLADTSWHHYALSLSNIGKVAFYVDGVIIDGLSYYFAYPTILPFINNYIGKSPNSTDDSLNASFNQFFVFNRVITANEIAMLADMRSSITPVTTIPYENFAISPEKMVYGSYSNFKLTYSNPYLVTNQQYSLKIGSTILDTKRYTGAFKSNLISSHVVVDDSGNVWSYKNPPYSPNFALMKFDYTLTYLDSQVSIIFPVNPTDSWTGLKYYNGLIYLVTGSTYAGRKNFFGVVNPYTQTVLKWDNTFYHSDIDIGNDGFGYAVSGTFSSDPYSTQWLVDKINLQTNEKTTIIRGTQSSFEGENGSYGNGLTSIAFDSNDNMFIGTQGGYLTKWNKSGTRLMAPIQIASVQGYYEALFFSCDKVTNTLYARGTSGTYVYAINTTTLATSLFANTTLDYSQQRPTIDPKDRRLYFGGYRFDLNPIPTITFNCSLTITANTLQIFDASGFQLGTQFTINGDYPCFLQGSKILRLDPETDEEEYVVVERLRRGDLIRTATCGYKAVAYIGRGTLKRPADDPDRKNRLYRFRDAHKKHPPLFITGEHCLLYKEKDISPEKRREVRDYMGDDYITEIYHRVPACLDSNGTPYVNPNDSEGPVTIWHFALEHNNLYNNYAVYANGILVETCSIDFLTNHTSMELI